MKKYYKMISLWPHNFGGNHKIMDWDEITPGRCFTARGKNYDWCLNKNGEPNAAILADVPVFHFCDNALDSVLWQSYLASTMPECFLLCPYEIRPLSTVYKERSRDGVGLYQCGAHKIEIVRQMTLGELERIAISEFESNPGAAIFRYPNVNILKIILEIKDMNNIK